MQQITRKDFLRLAGLSLSSLVVVACGGGGGGTPTQPDPGNFIADRDGSILDATKDLFTVDTRFIAEDINDWKVIKISGNGQVLLSGEALVFEINTSGELVGDGISVTKTQVKRGDHIHWKSLI